MPIPGSYGRTVNSHIDRLDVLAAPRQMVAYPDMLARDCILGELYRVDVRAALNDMVAFAIPDALHVICQKAALGRSFADYWVGKKP